VVYDQGKEVRRKLRVGVGNMGMKKVIARERHECMKCHGGIEVGEVCAQSRTYYSHFWHMGCKGTASLKSRKQA
jgi:hypothetical protein